VELFWDQNIELLKTKGWKLYQKVINHTPVDIGEIVPTKTVPTLRFHHPGKQYLYAYSTDDPIAEINSRLAILHNDNNLNQTVCIFTGMGLGYSQLVTLKKRPDIFRIMILEPSLDIFCMALKYVDLAPLLLSEKVSIFAGDIDWQEFDKTINLKKIETDFLFSDYLTLFDWNPELYNSAKNMANASAVRSISGVGVLNVHGERLFRNRISNMTLFREARSADLLRGAFKGKPVVIISAGPSLDRSMAELKEMVGRCVMVAVDSAVVPLLGNGISPDFVTTLDYRDHNSEKLSPDLIQSASFSLVANITSSVPTARRLPLKHLFFSFQENDTQSWLIDALNVEYQMPPAGTVASLALSFAQMVEADPVILVGYDFALTATETDHVEGVVFNHGWHLNKDTISIKGIHGGYVKTLNFLLEFKSNFEQILKHHSRSYINATASGAYIEGTSVQELKSVIKQYLSENLCVDNIVESAIQSKNFVELSHFILAAQHQIEVAKKSLKQINTVLVQNDKVKKYLQSQKELPRGITKFSQLPSSIQSSKQKIHKLYTGLKPFMPMEEMAAKKISEGQTVQEVEIAENYIETVAKEARVVGLLMEGHQYGLTVFIKDVGNLISFLTKEDLLLKRIEQQSVKERVKEGDLLELGELYLNDMDAVKACNILNKCISEYPDSNRAAILMGVAEAQRLNFPQALTLWENALKNDPESFDEVKKHRQRLADYWIERGQAEPGILEKCLRRALTIWNAEEFVQRIRGIWWETSARMVKSFIDNKRAEDAESFLSLWQPVRTSTPEWDYLMAKVLYEKNEKSEALVQIRSALNQEPQNAIWTAFAARLMLETGAFDSGIEALKKAVQLDPAQAVLWEELGDTLFELKDYTTAAVAYEKCFIAIPDKIDVLRKFGDCYYETGKFEAAKAAYQAVLERDGANEAALSNLSRL